MESQSQYVPGNDTLPNGANRMPFGASSGWTDQGFNKVFIVETGEDALKCRNNRRLSCRSDGGYGSFIVCQHGVATPRWLGGTGATNACAPAFSIATIVSRYSSKVNCFERINTTNYLRVLSIIVIARGSYEFICGDTVTIQRDTSPISESAGGLTAALAPMYCKEGIASKRFSSASVIWPFKLGHASFIFAHPRHMRTV